MRYASLPSWVSDPLPHVVPFGRIFSPRLHPFFRGPSLMNQRQLAGSECPVFKFYNFIFTYHLPEINFFAYKIKDFLVNLCALGLLIIRIFSVSPEFLCLRFLSARGT